MKVERFEIRDSRVNKGNMVLVAITEDGKEYAASATEGLVMVPVEKHWELTPEAHGYTVDENYKLIKI